MSVPATGPDLQILFARLIAGDEEAFTQLFYHYTRKLYPFVLQKVRVPDLAEEIVQDIFLRLWVYRGKLAGIESPENYLFRIAANRVQDHFREMGMKARLQKELHQGASTFGPHPEESIDLAEARNLLAMGVASMPAQRKRVFELKQEGLRYEEIAAILNISPNTVKNHLVEANRFLLEFLRERGLPVLLLILSWHRP